MGQQQLLLIVLGVIIVGIAVVVGINLFNASAESSAKDSLISEGTNLGALAQQFYKKPVEMGGGGNSFNNTQVNPPAVWSIPEKLDTTASATWSANVTAQKVTLTGTPKDVAYTWKAKIEVFPDRIVSKIE